MTGVSYRESGDTPEIGQTLQTGRVKTNYHDRGKGSPLLLIHGSGPGVSAWANWRLVLPELEPKARLIAPDMAGFGYSEVDGKLDFDIDMWINQLTDLLDGLGLDKVSVVGNSYGGAMALHLAHRHPNRVERIVLMGTVGISFALTYGLNRAWGYGASLDEMRELIGLFAYDQAIVTNNLVKLRYQASIRDDVQERFSSLFPAPRQQWIDALALDDEDLSKLEHEVLLIHGLNDRVIPVEVSRMLAERLPNARLVEIDKCGHWVQIEHTTQFINEVVKFLKL